MYLVLSSFSFLVYMEGEDEVSCCKTLNAVKNNEFSSKGCGVSVIFSFFIFSVCHS